MSFLQHIELFGFDSAVGTCKNKPAPQITFVPNHKDGYGNNKRQIVRQSS